MVSGMVKRADVDAIVVGGGLMGAATAWALAGRGRSVVLMEAHEFGHLGGSSHGSARIFRRAYPDPMYVRLSGRAGELWRELEHQTGEELLRTTGGLDHGASRGPAALRDVLRASRVPAELLDPTEAQARWPGMVFDGPVMFHPEAGVIDSERAVRAMVRQARADGALVRENAPVHRIELTDGLAWVHTREESWTASAVVSAAGAWTTDLLAGLVPLPPLRVTQQSVFHFGLADPSIAWPTFIYRDGVAGNVTFYGVPAGSDGGREGAIKVGEHENGTVTTAETRTGQVDPASRQRVVDYVTKRLPGLDASPFNERTCLYTWTQSEDWVLDRTGPLVVCSPCSGHGAKFAPLVGQLTADLATGERLDPQLARRFSLRAHYAH
jgi:sarcosine oxidase